MGKIYLYPEIKDLSLPKRENRNRSPLTGINQKTNSLNQRMSEPLSKTAPLHSKQYRFPTSSDPEGGYFRHVPYFDNNEPA